MKMAASIRQSEYADLLRAELVATDAKLQAAAGALGNRGLTWSPPGGGWSIGQVLEHLVVAADSYLRPMRRLIDEALAATGAGGDSVWRPSLLSSPISRLIRLNLGDCFAILVAHARRHLGQIERIKTHAEFPAIG